MVKIPPMTEERRKDIVKLIYIELEKAKIAVRNYRQDSMKTLKKQLDDKEISEDEKKANENNLLDMTSIYINRKTLNDKSFRSIIQDKYKEKEKKTQFSRYFSFCIY